MTESEGGRRIPADSFRIRLAIVRTEMGWNYDQAEAATGVGSESWRQWEKGLRHCTDVIGVSRKIAEHTPYDQTWLALGGPLSTENPEPRGRVRPIRKVRTPSNGECVRSPRPGRAPVAAGSPVGRYRYRLVGSPLADIA